MNVSIIVLTYNHEEYILDLLNSLKYQIVTYNSDKSHKVQLIVSDDKSKDNTVSRVKEWEKNNIGLIEDFIILEHENNVGTCRNYLSALDYCSGDYLKFVGGDDIFPEISIFDLFKYLDSYDMVYGMPFIFYENREANDVNEILRVMNKMDRIYMEESHINYYDLIHRECFINGPATYISKRLLTDSRVKESLLEYKYTDDYPQWIKMSEIKDVSFKYIPFVSVIYRRTSESAYIVRSGELLDERIKVFNYAKSTSRNIIEKLFVNSSLNNMYRMRKGKKPHKFEAINFLHEIYNIKNGKRKCRYTKKIINNTFEYIERIKLME